MFLAKHKKDFTKGENLAAFKRTGREFSAKYVGVTKKMQKLVLY